MSQDKVVPFDRLHRMGGARRGSADKSPGWSSVELECPYCAAVICLEASSLDAAEVLCAGCAGAVSIELPAPQDLSR